MWLMKGLGSASEREEEAVDGLALCDGQVCQVELQLACLRHLGPKPNRFRSAYIYDLWRTTMNADRLQIIKDELTHVDPTMAGDEDAEDFRAAVLVFAAACFGADVDDLAAFTGYPTDFVASVSQRMRSCGLWGEGFVNDDWYIEGDVEDQISPAGFWLDVLAAQGLVTVVGHDENGKAIFAAVRMARQ